jgi:hypothetical protein
MKGWRTHIIWGEIYDLPDGTFLVVALHPNGWLVNIHNHMDPRNADRTTFVALLSPPNRVEDAKLSAEEWMTERWPVWAMTQQ